MSGNDRCSFQTLNALLKALIVTASDEINDTTFAFIPKENAAYFEADELFGKTVDRKFPDARDEIREAEIAWLQT